LWGRSLWAKSQALAKPDAGEQLGNLINRFYIKPETTHQFLLKNAGAMLKSFEKPQNILSAGTIK
jgi:hypothetical protein